MTIKEFREVKIKRLIELKYLSVSKMNFDSSKELVRSSFDIAIAAIELIEEEEEPVKVTQ